MPYMTETAATETALVFTKDTSSKTGVTIYRATGAAYSFRLFQLDGVWYLKATPLGQILGVELRFDTMRDARLAAARIDDAEVVEDQDDDEPVVAAAAEVVETPVVAPAAAEQLALDLDPAAPAEVTVIACAAAKLDEPVPAAELYTSANFRLMLRAARAQAGPGGRVLILSALHGLLDLDTVVAPYNVKMGDAGCIGAAALAAQLRARGLDVPGARITTLLPRAYAQRLAEAVALAGEAEQVDLFADAPGIGYQRAVASRLLAEAC
ncbi:hypothetical protein FIONNBHARTH_90 [Mycobacterium phage Fionnbharth]|uniref:DUF6884 domain-containing protein n=1 Tax=Mycobacterium phage Fionnbharth TaxID=2923006 RepID=G8IR79_9CAUD|nr:hypothetical protein ACQ59_gp43 [Mycobacterium phage Fionnbharth]AER26381.1 hypothetical protein FIONNBHARTH_90 [Mycobacterium phage Fionnbharth]